jgi:CheY-like chemotaxis protein
MYNGFAPYSDFIDVKTFINGADLLSHISGMPPLENLPCLIILDINMPLLNGLQTLKLIRQQIDFETVPIVLFTTTVSEADRQFIEKHNAKVLLKPVDSVQFNEIVQAFISHCRADLPERGSCN